MTSDGRDFTLVLLSDRVAKGQQSLSRNLLSDLQIVLKRIDASFRTRYKELPWATDFAIEVEFKITAEGAISIKQARPWIF